MMTRRPCGSPKRSMPVMWQMMPTGQSVTRLKKPTSPKKRRMSMRFSSPTRTFRSVT
jgi:hypothetical protein